MFKFSIIGLIVVGVIVLIIKHIYTYKVRTVLARYDGYWEIDKGYIRHRGTDSKAYYNANTGAITFRAGSPDWFEKDIDRHNSFSTPKGKELSFDEYKYSSNVTEEMKGKYGTLKYNLKNRVKFEIAENQFEAKKEFDRLKAECEEKRKNSVFNFFDERFSVFLLSAIMAVSVCLVSLSIKGMSLCAPDAIIIPLLLYIAFVGIFVGQIVLLIYVNSMVIDCFIYDGAFSDATKTLFYILGIALGFILSLIAENLICPVEGDGYQFIFTFIVVGVDTAIIVIRGIGLIIEAISDAIRKHQDKKWK